MIHRAVLFALGAMILAAGCRREPIVVYQVPKESRQAGVGAATTGAAGPVAGITWEAPDHWEAQAPGQVRVGSYRVPGVAAAERPADFAITTFPGDVGGDLANVNRWREQIGLPAISAAELPSALRAVAAPAGEFLVVNFVRPGEAGAAGVRVIAAILKHPERTWFFKLTGDDALVAGQEAAFLQLLQSVRFDAAARPPVAAAALPPMPASTNDLPPGHPPVGGIPAPAADTAALPSGHPPVGGASLPAPAGGAAVDSAALPLRWAAPDHWVARPLSPLRLASFQIPGADGATADFSVITLAGAAGGLVDNVNRWRGQIGLPPQSAAEIQQGVEHLDNAGLHFDLVDLAGPGADGRTPTRTLGAILEHGGASWFFKLSGPDALVAAERAAFRDFIRSVRSQ